MNDGWQPIATHGDSEHKVRAVLERLQGLALNDARRQLQALGLTDNQVKGAAVALERIMAKRLDFDLPNIMRHMKATAPKD